MLTRSSSAARKLWLPSSSSALLSRLTNHHADYRLFSTESQQFKEERNMSSHHVNLSNQRPVGWTTYKNKFPVLVEELEEEYGHSENMGHGLVGKHIDENLLFDETPRTSILMELTDRVGILHDVLRYFWKYDINVSRIESRPMKPCPEDSSQKFDFFLDFDGDRSDLNVRNLLGALEPMANKLLILDSKDVFWFPRHISELDLIANRTLDAGVDLESDHPGFNDKEYRTRRAKLAESAQNHRWDVPIETIDYDDKEIAVWSAVWDKMGGLWEAYACEQYLVSVRTPQGTFSTFAGPLTK
jgi:hypothetical protein